MSYPDENIPSLRQTAIDVKVNNFPEAKRPRKTTISTYVLDPAATDLTKRSVQIADYEPTRLRLIVEVLDQPCIIIVDETPRTSPDVTTVGVAPSQGRVLLATSLFERVFLGPDAFYLNTISGATVGRVTVTKEYL